MDDKHNKSPEADGEVEHESSDDENWDNYPEIPPEEECKFDITEDVVVVEKRNRATCDEEQTGTIDKRQKET